MRASSDRKLVRDLSSFSPTWSYIMNIAKTNVAHLDAIDFFGHNDMDMMEIGMH